MQVLVRCKTLHARKQYPFGQFGIAGSHELSMRFPNRTTLQVKKCHFSSSQGWHVLSSSSVGLFPGGAQRAEAVSQQSCNSGHPGGVLSWADWQNLLGRGLGKVAGSVSCKHPASSVEPCAPGANRSAVCLGSPSPGTGLPVFPIQ